MRDSTHSQSSPASGAPAMAAEVLNTRTDASGFVLLERAHDALTARLALVDEAVESLDAKYFIWKGDAVGTLVFSRIVAAAERGVRVRLLIDDLNLDASEEELAGLDAHENFSIRIFNPPRSRSLPGALIDYASSFDDLNTRMHNKALICDQHAAIVGGRNIANEYFGLDDAYNFLDLDVLALGPVVTDIERSFDEYWRSEMAVSITELTKSVSSITYADWLNSDNERLAEEADLLAEYAAEHRSWHEWFDHIARSCHVGSAVYLQDAPGVADTTSPRLLDLIDATALPVRDELITVSAYLIPPSDLLDNIAKLCEEGVRIRVVTGTMAAVNHTASYAHYRKYIKPILDAGAELYEIDADPDALVRTAADVPPVDSGYMALHVKGVVADRTECFIGSLNLDPRALAINTENGLLVRSEGLAGQLTDWYETLISPSNAWQVLETVSGDLEWRRGDERRSSSPHRGGLHQVKAGIYEKLPIEDQL